MFQQVIN